MLSFSTLPQPMAGMTLIELLLVMALITIIAASTTPFLSRFVLQQQFDTANTVVTGYLHKAQSAAMSGKQNQTWGVCYSGHTIKLYSGSCGSPSYSQSYQLAASLSLTGLTDVTFNKDGSPSGVVNGSLSSSLDSATLTVNSAGLIALD